MLELVEVFEEDFVDVNEKPSLLDTEEELKEMTEEKEVLDVGLKEEKEEEADSFIAILEEVFEAEVREVLEADSMSSILMRAASILSHFLLLQLLFSFLG